MRVVPSRAAAPTTLPFAALFPGQLSEKPGMGEALAARWDFVGAWFEDSSATGIDGDQADDSAGDAGAVYVY